MSDASSQVGAAAGAVTETTSDFSALLNKEFRPKSDQAKTAVETAVRTLAEHALANTALISDDALKSIQGIIAEIDKKLTEQINQILHHPDFQQLESAWRGLHYLINNTETDEMLKIRVLNVSKKEMAKTLKKFKGTAWDQSPLFKKVYGEEFDVLGGHPYGTLVADYYFDHSPMDVELLGEMAKVAAAAHAPLLTAANPTLFQMETWSELSNPRDLTKIFQTPEFPVRRLVHAAGPVAFALWFQDEPDRGIRLRGGE
jgi:type VI secretion system protein ImpC